MAEKSMCEILAAWRELERKQSETDPDGHDYEMLELDIARLRSEYHRLMLSAIAHQDQLGAASRESYKRLSRSAEITEMARNTIRGAGRRQAGRG